MPSLSTNQRSVILPFIDKKEKQQRTKITNLLLRKTQLHQTATYNSNPSPKASNKEKFLVDCRKKTRNALVFLDFALNWFRKFALLSQPNGFKTKRYLDARVFPRFMQFHFTQFLSFKWLLVKFSFVLIDWCNYFGFFFFLRFCLRHSINILVVSENVRSTTDGDTDYFDLGFSTLN